MTCRSEPPIEYEHLFPFAKIRDEQRRAIEFVLESFASGKRFVVVSAPTGLGKSAIAVTVARAMQTDAYVLTPQKVLQEQYVNDFGPDKLDLMRSIKSASNYDCRNVFGQTCGETRRVIAMLKKRKDTKMPEELECCKQACPYLEDKTAFMNSPLGITNFSFFLAETMYAKQLKPRGLLVCDEAHGVEAQLSAFIEVSFSVRFARTQLK
jgi:Rad3-related DNA helicase